MIDIVLSLAFLGASLSTVDVNSKIYIDTDEPKYYSVSTPVDVNLGVGVLQGKTQITKQLLKNNIYSSYSQKILYKYPNAISAPIEIYDDCYLNLNKGSFESFTYSCNEEKSTTYSTEIRLSVTKKLGAEVKIGTGFGTTKAEASMSKELGFEAGITKNISKTYTSSITKEKTINFAITEDGNYRLEKRGMFEVYIVEYITGVYDIPTTKIAYYTIDTTYILSYIEGSDSIGLFKYNSLGSGRYELDYNYAHKYFNEGICFID